MYKEVRYFLEWLHPPTFEKDLRKIRGNLYDLTTQCREESNEYKILPDTSQQKCKALDKWYTESDDVPKPICKEDLVIRDPKGLLVEKYDAIYGIKITREEIVDKENDKTLELTLEKIEKALDERSLFLPSLHLAHALGFSRGYILTSSFFSGTHQDAQKLTLRSYGRGTCPPEQVSYLASVVQHKEHGLSVEIRVMDILKGINFNRQDSVQKDKLIIVDVGNYWRPYPGNSSNYSLDYVIGMTTDSDVMKTVLQSYLPKLEKVE
jgi:hypothetical protein